MSNIPRNSLNPGVDISANTISSQLGNVLAPAGRCVLVLHADTAYGAATAMKFAMRGARIALQFEGDDTRVLEIAALLTRKGAIALPLECPLSSRITIEKREELLLRTVGRIIEDFGRLDDVIFPVKGGQLGLDAKQGTAQTEDGRMVLALARAAAPHLKRARPMGHFTIMMPLPEMRDNTPVQPPCSSVYLREDLDLLIAETAAEKGRPCINIIHLRGVPDARGALFVPLPEDAADSAATIALRNYMTNTIVPIFPTVE